MKTRSTNTSNDQPSQQPVASRTRGKRTKGSGRERRLPPPPPQDNMMDDTSSDDEAVETCMRKTRSEDRYYNNYNNHRSGRRRGGSHRHNVYDEAPRESSRHNSQFEESTDEEDYPPPRKRKRGHQYNDARHVEDDANTNGAAIELPMEAITGLIANRIVEHLIGDRIKSAIKQYEVESCSEEECDSSELEDSDEYDSLDDEEDYSEYAKERKYRKSLDKKQRAHYDATETRLRELSGAVIPIKYSILDSNMAESVKARCLEYVSQITEDEDSSDAKRRSWLQTLLKVPFGKYSVLIEADSTKDGSALIKEARQCLDSVVYGNRVVKDTLQELVAQRISNPQGRPPVIGLIGPPGVGKTTIARYGIAKALNKPFYQISCGGLQDAASLRGHSYTWEGSTHGALLDAVMQTGCMDPVILLDEIDKIGETKHGQEVQSMLIHLLDPTQNCSFQDEYFSGIDLDFSRAVFVLSLNDSSSMSPILRDRVQFVKMDTPTANDKVAIAQRFLIQKSLDNVGISSDKLTFAEETLQKAISNGLNEEGVRNLYRSIEGCIRKLNLLRLLDDDEKRNYLKDLKAADVQSVIDTCNSSPMNITPKVYELIKPNTVGSNNSPPFGMYM